MRTSPRGLMMVKSEEDCRLQAYRPVPTDPWTIGWGHTGPEVVEGLTWTQAQADEELLRDLDIVERGITNLVRPGRGTRQCEFDALVCFAYNCGLDIDADKIAEGLGDSTLLALHNAGARLDAADEFPKWCRAGGQRLRGLKLRRLREALLYLIDA